MRSTGYWQARGKGTISSVRGDGGVEGAGGRGIPEQTWDFPVDRGLNMPLMSGNVQGKQRDWDEQRQSKRAQASGMVSKSRLCLPLAGTSENECASLNLLTPVWTQISVPCVRDKRRRRKSRVTRQSQVRITASAQQVGMPFSPLHPSLLTG